MTLGGKRSLHSRRRSKNNYARDPTTLFHGRHSRYRVSSCHASRQFILKEARFHVCNRRFQAYRRRGSARWSHRGWQRSNYRGNSRPTDMRSFGTSLLSFLSQLARQTINNNVQHCSFNIVAQWSSPMFNVVQIMNIVNTRCSKRMYSPQRDDYVTAWANVSTDRMCIGFSTLITPRIVRDVTGRRDFAWILLFNFNVDNSQKRCRLIELKFYEILEYRPTMKYQGSFFLTLYKILFHLNFLFFENVC